jgi:hypothetical protein
MNCGKNFHPAAATFTKKRPPGKHVSSTPPTRHAIHNVTFSATWVATTGKIPFESAYAVAIVSFLPTLSAVGAGFENDAPGRRIS